MEDVKIFLTERTIGAERYAEQVCARNWQEAEGIASASGAKVIGELQHQVCARCGLETDTASTVNKARPLGDDEWPDEVE